MVKTLRYSLVSLLLMIAGVVSAQTTVVFKAGADMGTNSSEQAPDQITKDGVTIATSSGPLARTDNYRIYKGSTLTITSSIGDITNIEIISTANAGSQYGPDLLSANVGNYTTAEKIGTWEGVAAEVVFTASAQVRATQISVTVNTAGGETKKAAGLEFSINKISVEKGEAFTAPTFTKETTAPVSFSSDNEGVAKVSADGVISLAGGLGIATITATSEANDIYNAGKAVCTVEVYGYNIYKKVNTITSGKTYLLVAQRDGKTYYAYPLSETAKYGYMKVGTIEETVDQIKVKTTYDDSFTFTADGNGYTIKDPLGRYIIQTGTYNSFQLSEEPGIWTIDAQSDGTFKITMNNYFIQWGQGTYTTFGIYPEMQENAVLPYLYQLDETSTGVESVEMDIHAAQTGETVIYNLNGQRLQKMQKGINIVNGKKVLMK